jgi:hypothetical protein
MLMVMKKNDENELVAAYFEARLSSEDQTAFEARLSEDQDFADKVRLHASLLRLRQRRKNLHVIRQVLGKNTQAAKDVQTQLPHHRRIITTLSRHPYLLVACGLLLILVAYLALHHELPRTPSPGPTIESVSNREEPTPSRPNFSIPDPTPRDSNLDSLHQRQQPAEPGLPGTTMLVSTEDARGDSNIWESSIHGMPLPLWLSKHQVEIPKKIDPTALNRVTVAKHLCLVTQGHPERLQRVVVFCDLDLEAPQYFSGQTLFLFFPKDPRDMALHQLYLLRHGRKQQLYLDGKTYLIRVHGSMDNLLQLPQG